jgi:hypothetical protein
MQKTDKKTRKKIAEHLKFDTDRYNLYAVKHHDPNESIVDSGDYVQIHFVVLDNHSVDKKYSLTTATTFVMDTFINNGKWSKIIRELQDGYVLKLKENLKGLWTIKEELSDYRCGKPTMVISADNSFQISKRWLKDNHDHCAVFDVIKEIHELGNLLEQQNDVIDINKYIEEHNE